MLSRSPSALSFESTHLIYLIFCVALLLLGGDETPRSADGHSKVHVNVGFILSMFSASYFLMLPSSLFAFSPPSEHWVGISRKLSTVNVASLSLMEAADLEPAAVCVLLVLFSLACIALHSLTLGSICHLLTQPALCHPAATFWFQLLADYFE